MPEAVRTWTGLRSGELQLRVRSPKGPPDRVCSNHSGGPEMVRLNRLPGNGAILTQVPASRDAAAPVNHLQRDGDVHAVLVERSR